MSIDLSLHRIQALLGSLEPYTRPTIHIAGTNGKGSVSAILTSVFRAADAPLSVGRFNSPHLVDVLDSITLNDEAVSKSLYDSIREEVESKDKKKGIGASSFELLTVAALLIFERANVDIVVCEVGMGGRLDATNVIPDSAILVSVITSIDLDHQAFLGSTVAAIAREKAGIVRRGKPVVLSCQNHEDTARVVQEVVDEVGAELFYAPLAVYRPWDNKHDGPPCAPFSLIPFCPPPSRPVEVAVSETEPYRILLPLHGQHQLVNVGAAVTVIHLLRTNVATANDLLNQGVTSSIAGLTHRDVYNGVRNCVWPGRLSFHRYSSPGHKEPLTILADGAHNHASSGTLGCYISSLVNSLLDEGNSRSPEGRASEKRTITLTYVLALSSSPPKTPEDVLSPLFTHLSSLSFSSVSQVRIKPRVALLRFTPPAGMPWVKSIAPSILRKVVAQIGNDADDLDIWSASDEELNGYESSDEPALLDLEKALKWAANEEDGKEALVIVAGSLYLVADLYRLLNVPRREKDGQV